MKRNIRNVKIDVHTSQSTSHTTQKGITLIALVITIIVLLILAGVAINLAVDANGLFSRANEAKTEWNNRVAEEGTTIENILQLANEIDVGTGGGGNTLPAGWDPNKVVSTVTENSMVAGVTKERTAPIPKGFTASNVTGEDKIEKGLVIYEGTDPIAEDADALTTRNQYVWIPVDDINSMIMCKSNSEDSECVLTPDENGNLVCITHNNSTDLVGRLYITTDTRTAKDITYTMDFSKRDQTYDENNFHEPNTVSDDSSNSVTISQLRNDFKDMAKSVYTYGGFYISRYEVGERGSSKKDQKILTAASSASDPDNYLAGNGWYGLYNTLRKAGTAASPNSHMIWGSQYDQVIKFIGSEAQKGHSDRQEKRLHTSGTPTETGKQEGKTDDILKNIYDLEGNCYEWTTEAYDSDRRTLRGGDYDNAWDGDFYPAANRGSLGPGFRDIEGSTRASLYL